MLIRYQGGGFTKILPLREVDHDSTIELLIVLQNAWMANQENTTAIVAEFWQIFDAICRSVPCVPGLGWDLEQLKNDLPLVEALFLRHDGTMLKMHEFEPKTRESRDAIADESLPLIAENLPFPTGGNPKADRIASYLYGTEWGPQQVEGLFKWLSREELSSLIWSLSELGNPDRRIADEKAKIAEAYGEIPFDPANFMDEDWN